MKRQISISLAFAILVAYSVIASILFFYYGLPSLEGKISQQMYSDSVTYEQVADAYDSGDELVSIGGNYLGPVFVLRFFDFNRISIHFFNLSILFLSVLMVFKYLYVNRGIFLLGILTSPLLFFSMFGVNKEIFLLPFSICLLIFLRSRSAIWLVCSIIAAFFVRWQMVIFVLLVFFATSNINIFQKKRWLILIFFTLAMTVAYPILASGALDAIQQISIEGARDELGSQASGIFSAMVDMQQVYGYFLILIPKTIQLLIGFLARFSIASIEIDFWNNFVIMLQSLHNFFLLGLVLIYRRFHLSNDYFYLICIFSVLFAVTPVFAPRYFYPVSIWFALWLSSKNTKIRKILPCRLLKYLKPNIQR